MTETLHVATRVGGAAIDRTASIPAVVYGPKQESVPLTLDRKVFVKLYETAGESTIITLEGLDEPLEVLIQDVAFDSVRNLITHVDFYAIERGKELTTNVPLVYVGESAAEDDGGILTKVLYEVEVTCRPSVLPHELEVDISTLDEVGAQITIADLTLPESVTITNDDEDIVAQVVAAKEEPVEPEEDEASIEDVEVEGKGKEEDAEAAEEPTDS